MLASNPVHSALSLVGTLVGVALFFLQLVAHLVAAVQIIVYAIAIVVLFKMSRRRPPPQPVVVPATVPNRNVPAQAE